MSWRSWRMTRGSGEVMRGRICLTASSLGPDGDIGHAGFTVTWCLSSALVVEDVVLDDERAEAGA